MKKEETKKCMSDYSSCVNRYTYSGALGDCADRLDSCVSRCEYS